MRNSLIYWWSILRDSIQLWVDCNAFTYAGALAFYTLFSLAPIMVIAVAVIGVFFGEEAAQGQIVADLEEAIGRQPASAVEEALARSRIEGGGLLPTLMSIGGLLVGATVVFAQMQQSLNAIWGVMAKPERSGIFIFIRSRLLSLAMVLSIGFILLVSMLASIALRVAVRYAEAWIPLTGGLLSAGELLVFLLLITGLFALIFRVLPDVVVNWRDVAVGAVVTAILFSVGRYIIAVYLVYTAPDSAYGAAGSLVILLLWVYYSTLILLFGAAFTKVHMLARGKHVVPRNLAAVVKNQIIEEPQPR